MSRTYAHRPAWVQKYDNESSIPTAVRHDHRNGECVVETFEYARADAGGAYKHWRHSRNCKKREVVTHYCTRKNPEYRGSYPPNRYSLMCWSSSYDYLDGAFTSVRCAGHEKLVMHDEIPCSCDLPRPAVPTCTVDWTWRYYHMVTKIYGDHVPSDRATAEWYGPERVRVRDELRKARALYRADPDDDFDFDFPNPQHKHRSSYSYW